VSRALTFWTDDQIRLIREDFIAASVPTWLCRSNSPEGEFLRGAGIDKRWVTSSGYMHCVSASGKLLGGRPSANVLEEFAKLPESERRAGAIRVGELSPEDREIPSPPSGGLVLRVHARFLARSKDGSLRPATTADFPLMQEKPRVAKGWRRFLEPNTEYLWLTREEREAFVPKTPKVGDVHAVDEAIVQRIARFHLTPKRATTSEGGIVHRKRVRPSRIEAVVTEIGARTIGLTLRGVIRWGTEYDAAKATTPNGPLEQGFETPIHGRVEYDRATKRFTRFAVVAPGEVWGRWGDANGKSMYVERPGRAPFGFAIELATGESPTDRIPPGGNGRYVTGRTGYFASTK